MENPSPDRMRLLAEDVWARASVSAGRFMLVPGNTPEKYVDYLIENYVDAGGMDAHDLERLKAILLERTKREAGDEGEG